MNPSNSKQEKRFLEFGPFQLDIANRLLLRDGSLVSLKRKAVDTLFILVERRGEVVSKDELIENLWPDTFVEESNLSQYIYLLRKSLGEGEYITTISGRGYRFTADVREIGKLDDQIVLESETIARLVITEEHTDDPVDRGVAKTPIEHSVIRLFFSSVTRRKLAVFLAVFVAVLAAMVALWRKPGTSGPPAPPSRLVFATAFAGNEAEPAFSPDGKQIAFTWEGETGNNVDIYVKFVDVGTPLRLTTDPEVDRFPVWSPDGRYLAFLRGSDSGRNVILVPALGGPERNLGAALAGLDWSPDGNTLAVIDDGAVTVLNLENGQRKRLTTPPTNILGDVNPVFSPDGKTLAFTRSDGGAENIFVVASAGGETRQITSEKSRIQSLCWTRDGGDLIYSSNRGGTFHLWKIGKSGGEPQQVASAGTDPLDVVLSNDGSMLAFARSTFDTNIWRSELPARDSPIPGKDNLQWTQFAASSRADHTPQYSPDGMHIAFISHRSGDEEIWVCDVDGTRERQVTHIKGPSTGSLRWSPNGREIAFDSRMAGQADIFVINVEGGQPRQLTTDPALDVAPCWSRDGQWIYFSSMRSGKRQIWKSPANGGDAVSVTQNGGFDSYESPDGKFLYYTRQRETAGVWRLQLETGNEEAIAGLEGIKDHRSWILSGRRLYFVQSTRSGAVLKFLDLATGRVANVATLQKNPVYGPPGLAVSPDGRSVLYVQRDSSASDIMVVENFK